MSKNGLRWFMCLSVAALALSATGAASQAQERRFGGTIDNYTANIDGNGAWHLDGEWSLQIKGESGKADFSVGVQMARAGTGVSPHTHHLAITDGQVTELSNGYQITGTAVITLNGNVFPAASGSRVTVTITGGAAVPFSNLAVVFDAPASGHFGTQPIMGVVTR